MRLSPEIVAAMQRLAVEQRGLVGPRASWHAGDIAWQARMHDDREHEWRIRLWVADGRTVAWSWLTGKGDLEYDVHPEHLDLLDELLAEPAARVAHAFADDGERRDALARHGFVEPGAPLHFYARDVAEPPDPPPLPDGFRYRTVSDEHGVGEFEPVGVRPEFRRRGLGAAVCAYALRRLYEEGGRQAVVYCQTEPACALYETVGFRLHASLVGYGRQSAAA